MLTKVAHVAFIHKLNTRFNKSMNITSTFHFCKFAIDTAIIGGCSFHSHGYQEKLLKIENYFI